VGFLQFIAWAPASPQMTDRALAGSQFSTNCERKTIKAFRGYKSKRFSDIFLEVY
jgi:hypothetical protein